MNKKTESEVLNMCNMIKYSVLRHMHPRQFEIHHPLKFVWDRT